MMLPIRLAGLLALLAAALGTAGALAQGLPPAVDVALASAKLPREAVTMLVVEVDGKSAPRLSHLAQVPVNPASVMKLVTTFAALDQLGPAFTWRTPVYVEGTLRDGTLVLAVPMSERWGAGLERATRTAQRLDVANHMQVTLYFSFDDGRSWKGPLPVFGGQNVSETDFVELPSGDLLLVNNSIFAYPGRQMLYREGEAFTPGPLERVEARFPKPCA